MYTPSNKNDFKTGLKGGGVGHLFPTESALAVVSLTKVVQITLISKVDRRINTRCLLHAHT